jgi:hypothetical protein
VFIITIDLRRRKTPFVPIDSATAYKSWRIETPVLPLQSTLLGLPRKSITYRAQYFLSGTGSRPYSRSQDKITK